MLHFHASIGALTHCYLSCNDYCHNLDNDSPKKPSQLSCPNPFIANPLPRPPALPPSDSTSWAGNFKVFVGQTINAVLGEILYSDNLKDDVKDMMKFFRFAILISKFPAPSFPLPPLCLPSPALPLFVGLVCVPLEVRRRRHIILSVVN